MELDECAEMDVWIYRMINVEIRKFLVLELVILVIKKGRLRWFEHKTDKIWSNIL